MGEHGAPKPIELLFSTDGAFADVHITLTMFTNIKRNGASFL